MALSTFRLVPRPTFARLLITSLGAVAIAVLTMANVRDRLTEVRREQLRQARHLRPLVPQANGERSHEAGAIVGG